MSNETLIANEASMANNSGQGKGTIVPEVVSDKFNWGAFLLSWIWGLGNKSYITLTMLATVVLVFIPFVNMLAGMAQLGLAIWFGIKGNEWAWQNKKFESIEAFHAYQKKWALAGTVLAIFGIICAIAIIFLVMAVAMSGISAD